MTETLHANIFFLITSIAVILFTILVCVLMVYLIKIVKIIKRIMERIEAGSEVVAEDLSNLRDMMRIEQLIGFMMDKMTGSKRKKEENSTNKKNIGATLHSRHTIIYSESKKYELFMAKKKSEKGLSNTQKAGIGIGITAAALAAAGTYFLHGSKNASANRKKVKSWMLKAKAEVLEGLEKAEHMTKSEYDALVDMIGMTYSKVSSSTQAEVAEFKKEMKAHWPEIEKKGKSAVQKIVATAKGKAESAKKTATKKVKKATSSTAKKATKKATKATKKTTKKTEKKK